MNLNIKPDWLTAVRMGNVPNHKIVSIVGRNEGLSTSYETMWFEGGLYSFPPSATSMTVSSDNAADTSAGTGARTVLIDYLDTNYDYKTEIVTLSGTTPVTTTATDILRVNKLRALTVGSGGVNTGNIYIGTGTVTAGKPATIYRRIEPSIGQDRDAVYTVPRNKGLLLNRLYMTSEAAKLIHNQVSISLFGLSQVNGLDLDVVGNAYEMDLFGAPAPEKSDILLNGKMASGAGIGEVVLHCVEFHVAEAPNSTVNLDTSDDV